MAKKPPKIKKWMLKSESLGFCLLPGSEGTQIGWSDLPESVVKDMVQSCSKMLLASGK